MGTKYQMRQQGSSFTVTTTHEDDDGKPLDGSTETFDNQQEAEDYMSSKTDTKTDSATDKTVHGEDAQNPPTTNQGLDSEQHEKPASQMTEADAVALNADVHLATPQQSERIVTEGEKEQVEAGLHPDPKEGVPITEHSDQ